MNLWDEDIQTLKKKKSKQGELKKAVTHWAIATSGKLSHTCSQKLSLCRARLSLGFLFNQAGGEGLFPTERLN